MAQKKVGHPVEGPFPGHVRIDWTLLQGLAHFAFVAFLAL